VVEPLLEDLSWSKFKRNPSKIMLEKMAERRPRLRNSSENLAWARSFFPEASVSATYQPLMRMVALMFHRLLSERGNSWFQGANISRLSSKCWFGPLTPLFSLGPSTSLSISRTSYRAAASSPWWRWPCLIMELNRLDLLSRKVRIKP
jgi:hypothetical protein